MPWRIVDKEAYEKWCYENNALDGYRELDWSILKGADYYNAWKWIRDNYPQLIVSSEQIVEPDDYWIDRDWDDAIDTVTGQVIPGLEYVPESKGGE